MSVGDRAQSTSAVPFRGGGDAGALLRALDWSASPLGEPTAWPDALKSAIALMLASAHPMMVLWGPRLVVFYNDAFRQSLGPEKHPRAMGKSLRAAFPESYPLLEPEFAGVLSGEGAVWRENRQIPIHRHGILTDAYWTYSASPIEDGDAVGGVLFICQETTGGVRREAMITAEDTSLRLALESGRIGSWTLDLTNEAFDCTVSCKINFGRNPHAAFSWAELKAAVHPEDQARMQAALARAIERGEDYDIEHRIVRPDQRETWLLVRGRVAYDAAGEPLTMAGVTMDVTGRKRAEEHLRLVVDELNHRVKNTLATVQSMTQQSLRGDDTPPHLRETLESRLLALSSAHDVLTDEQWSGADLAPIVRRACDPFDSGGRIEIAGPSVRLSPRIAIALALAFHELCTNAVKYGALSLAGGRVDVRWDFQPGSDQAELEITWRESGGPPVAKPTRRGFGSRMIERSLSAELGGKVTLDYAPEGLVCRLAVSLSGSVLKAKGARLTVARDGDSWTVADDGEVLEWFETQADAIGYLTEQLNALRLKGRSGTVIFNTVGPNDPPRRRARGARFRR